MVVVAGGLLLWRGLGSRCLGFRSAGADGAHSNAARLAVLPFEVSGGDTSLAHSVAQLLTDGVSQRYSVPTVDGRDLLGRWTADRRRTAAPLADNAAFAYGLGANQMVVGSAVTAGNNLRLSVDVYDTHDLTRLVHGDQTGTGADLFGLVDKLAAQVATAMCTQPEFNPAKLCFDTPARAKGILSVTDVPEPGEAPPTTPSFFVWVDSTGEGCRRAHPDALDPRGHQRVRDGRRAPGRVPAGDQGGATRGRLGLGDGRSADRCRCPPRLAAGSMPRLRGTTPITSASTRGRRR